MISGVYEKHIINTLAHIHNTAFDLRHSNQCQSFRIASTFFGIGFLCFRVLSKCLSLAHLIMDCFFYLFSPLFILLLFLGPIAAPLLSFSLLAFLYFFPILSAEGEHYTSLLLCNSCFVFSIDCLYTKRLRSIKTSEWWKTTFPFPSLVLRHFKSISEK